MAWLMVMLFSTRSRSQLTIIYVALRVEPVVVLAAPGREDAIAALPGA